MTKRLLDISRLTSRIGAGQMTGIDRVEFAYFRELLDRPEQVFFLCRVSRGYVVLDRNGGAAIFDRIRGKVPWGRRDLRSRLAFSLTKPVQQAQSDLRRQAIGRCGESDLPEFLPKLFKSDVTYLNVGHSNLREVVFDAVDAMPSSRKVVFVHDVIPLTHPEYSRPDVVERFENNMQMVALRADFLIYNSSDTEHQAVKTFSAFGRVPPAIVAHLGIGLPPLDDDTRFQEAAEEPNFVVLGTIEPRKNHALLLKVWADMVENMPSDKVPMLHIVGRRGWNNSLIFKILDGEDNVMHYVAEHDDLDDIETIVLLQQSWGLLCPSFVEGFGLPLLEAAYLGVPVVCGQNAIYREILDDYPLYAAVDNPYQWTERILERAGRKRESKADRQTRGESVKIPSWPEHFDRIFRSV